MSRSVFSEEGLALSEITLTNNALHLHSTLNCSIKNFDYIVDNFRGVFHAISILSC